MAFRQQWKSPKIREVFDSELGKEFRWTEAPNFSHTLQEVKNDARMVQGRCALCLIETTYLDRNQFLEVDAEQTLQRHEKRMKKLAEARRNGDEKEMKSEVKPAKRLRAQRTEEVATIFRHRANQSAAYVGKITTCCSLCGVYLCCRPFGGNIESCATRWHKQGYSLAPASFAHVKKKRRVQVIGNNER